MKLTYIQIIRIALLLLILATIAFIFAQSALPPEKSKEESDEVGGIIAEIIPPDTPVGDYLQTNIRKIAHFVEFAFLGLWVSLYVILKFPKLSVILASFPAALFLALLDESIQIFSERGPSVSDVWIDFSGFCFSALIIYTVYTLTVFIHNKCKQKQSF